MKYTIIELIFFVLVGLVIYYIFMSTGMLITRRVDTEQRYPDKICWDNNGVFKKTDYCFAKYLKKNKNN